MWGGELKCEGREEEGEEKKEGEVRVLCPQQVCILVL